MPTEPTVTDWLNADVLRRRLFARVSPDTGKMTVQLCWVDKSGIAREAWGHGDTQPQAIADAMGQPGVPPVALKPAELTQPAG